MTEVTLLEPAHLQVDFLKSDFEALMIKLADAQVSDITLITGKPIFAKLHGNQFHATKRSLQESEVRRILEWIYGTNAQTEISRKRALDYRYEISVGNNQRVAFRMNAVGVLSSRGSGLHITLRVMPREIPSLDTMDVPQEIIDSINIGKGLFAVVGETGSGKSTLLTGMMNHIHTHCTNRKIATFESPVEFDLSSLKSPTNVLIQCEIGDSTMSNLSSFYEGIMAALRQAPTDILIGEARNKETILATLHAAETGHATYVTIHAESVRTTFTRVAQEFESNVFQQTIFKLITQFRVIVCQRLAVPLKPGRRVAIREWLIIDADLRQRLLRMTAQDALNEIEAEVERKGQSFAQQAMRAYERRLISATELTKYVGDVATSFPEIWGDEEVAA